MKDFFKFEEEGYDFPFYNGIPKISTIDWIILALSIIAVGLLINFPIIIDDNLFSIALCLVTLIPLLYVSRGKIDLFFRMPKRKDIKLIIICVILYYIYAMGSIYILELIGIQTAANASNGAVDLLFILISFIQIIGEELIKVIVFLIAMFLVYKITNNRKLSIVISTAIALLIFGLMHYSAYNGNLIQIIFIIGLGSVFYMYAYLKTKNVVVSYLCHIIIDGLVFGLTLLATLW